MGYPVYLLALLLALHQSQSDSNIRDVVVLFDFASWIHPQKEKELGLEPGELFWLNPLPGFISTEYIAVNNTAYTFIFFAEDVLGDTYFARRIPKDDIRGWYNNYSHVAGEGIREKLREISAESIKIKSASFAGFMAALNVYRKEFIGVTNNVVLLAGPSLTNVSGKTVDDASQLLKDIMAERKINFGQLRFSVEVPMETQEFLHAVGIYWWLHPIKYDCYEYTGRDILSNSYFGEKAGTVFNKVFWAATSEVSRYRNIVVLFDYTAWVHNLADQLQGDLFWRNVLNKIVEELTPDDTTFAFVFFATKLEGKNVFAENVPQGKLYSIYENYLRPNMSEFAGSSTRYPAASFNGFMEAVEYYRENFMIKTDKVLLLAGSSFTSEPRKTRDDAVRLLREVYAERPIHFAQIRFSNNDVAESDAFRAETGNKQELYTRQRIPSIAWESEALVTEGRAVISALLQLPKTEYDPCALDNGGCSQLCNVHRYQYVECKCRDDYVVDPEDSTRCINPCLPGNGGCEQLCTVVEHNVVCGCFEGLLTDPDDESERCYNPCTPNNGGCGELCLVENNMMACGCNDGRAPDPADSTQCVDPCEMENGGCHQICTVPKNEVLCKCEEEEGDIIDPADNQCKGPCEINNGGCRQVCIVEENHNVRCACLDGYIVDQRNLMNCLEKRTLGVIKSVRPLTSHAVGGTSLTITGEELNTVTAAVLVVNVVHRYLQEEEAEENTTWTTQYTGTCRITSAARMVCVTPAVDLPEPFIAWDVDSAAQTDSNFTIALDNHTLDYFIGFELDEDVFYETLRDVVDVESYGKILCYSTKPSVVVAEHTMLPPFADRTIRIQGDRFALGFEESDYKVMIWDNEVCGDVDVSLNEITCTVPDALIPAANTNTDGDMEYEITVHAGLNLQLPAGTVKISITQDEITPTPQEGNGGGGTAQQTGSGESHAPMIAGVVVAVVVVIAAAIIGVGLFIKHRGGFHSGKLTPHCLTQSTSNGHLVEQN